MGENSMVIYTLVKGLVTYFKENIGDYGFNRNSMMPEGLEKNLTENDPKDLLSFLLERLLRAWSRRFT